MPRDRGTSPSVQRVLVCLCLCGLSVTCFALPVQEIQDNPQTDKQMQLERIMYRLGERGRTSPNIYRQALLTGSEQRKKRFGIAGLDNVDVITSILDQQRARKKPRRPTMSVSLSFEDIRRMMEAGR